MGGIDHKFNYHSHIFLQKTRYRVNLQTKQCEKRTLNDTFRPIGVPDYAKYIDTVEIGSNAVANAGIEVNFWAGDNPGKRSYFAMTNKIYYID